MRSNHPIPFNLLGKLTGALNFFQAREYFSLTTLSDFRTLSQYLSYCKINQLQNAASSRRLPQSWASSLPCRCCKTDYWDENLNFSDVELPSNRKFGFFFAFIFTAAAVYGYAAALDIALFICGPLGALFFLVAITRDRLLLPLNRLWMQFGLFLGSIISPLVLGLIFFGIFTPLAIVFRVSGRDELRLRYSIQRSYWVDRELDDRSDHFRQQF